MKDHMKVHDCSCDYVSCNDPRASEAMAVLKNLEKMFVLPLACNFVVKKFV